MQLKINGETREVPDGTTIADLVADLPHRGVAVALNGTVIPQGKHAETTLTEGSVVEIVTAVQGG